MSTDTIRTTESVKAKRDYLTEQEVSLLIDAAKKQGRHGQRDALILLVAYRHGLRSCELVDLTWDQVNFKLGTLLVHRAKNGANSTHPLTGDELRSLRILKKDSQSPYIFVSERGDRMTTANVRQLCRKLRQALNLDIPLHAHALRHACGHKLADQGIDTRRIQDYLGHKNIQNTQRYTQLSAAKFKGFDKII